MLQNPYFSGGNFSYYKDILMSSTTFLKTIGIQPVERFKGWPLIPDDEKKAKNKLIRDLMYLTHLTELSVDEIMPIVQPQARKSLICSKILSGIKQAFKEHKIDNIKFYVWYAVLPWMSWKYVKYLKDIDKLLIEIYVRHTWIPGWLHIRYGINILLARLWGIEDKVVFGLGVAQTGDKIKIPALPPFKKFYVYSNMIKKIKKQLRYINKWAKDFAGVAFFAPYIPNEYAGEISNEVRRIIKNND
jgi:hypothetical protein